MRNEFKDFLFSKMIFVNDTNNNENYKEVAIALANKLGIQIIEGVEKLNVDILHFASEMYGNVIPAPFYQSFPEGVLKLTQGELLVDQFFHYVITYGLGKFDEPGHSIFEENVARNMFNENYEIKRFTVLDEAEAVKYLFSVAEDMAKNSRPLTSFQYEVFLYLIQDYGFIPTSIASKDLATKLYLDTLNTEFVKYLNITDVIRVVDYIQFTNHRVFYFSPLHLTNKERKAITMLIDNLTSSSPDITACYEKKKKWAILLHHIHYKPINVCGVELVNAMRGSTNNSAYSRMEESIKNGNVIEAVQNIVKEKGKGEAVRHLDYFISRSNNSDFDEIINMALTNNPILLLQLYYHYKTYNNDKRVFTFSKHNILFNYSENSMDLEARKTKLDEEKINALSRVILNKLKNVLAGKLGKVYISEEMKNIAFPIKEDVGSTGLGILPKGSRIKLPDDKIIRAFTYWELVNDIDLSALGLYDDGTSIEFSWRSMFNKQSTAICYSGDETSGYKGGSEYFDVNLKLLKDKYPKLEYLIFTDVIYSNTTFDNCVCRAGYMLRDKVLSGEIFEPKTVKTSFTINALSRYAFLFAIDLKTNELVWLNIMSADDYCVAALADFNQLNKIFKYRDIMSVYDFISMCGTIVDNPDEADLIVDDNYEGDKETIHSYDVEKILALLG